MVWAGVAWVGAGLGWVGAAWAAGMAQVEAATESARKVEGMAGVVAGAGAESRCRVCRAEMRLGQAHADVSIGRARRAWRSAGPGCFG